MTRSGRSSCSSRNQRPRHRGYALLIVTFVMATAAVMGYAMLSDSTMRGIASANSANAVVAQSMAESGINLAMYYLQKPQNAPVLSGGYWPGQNATPITFSNGASGTFGGNVKVSITASNGVYTVTSIGSSAGGALGGGAVTRTITAQITIKTAYQITQAASCNAAVTIPATGTFTGSPTAVQSSQKVTLTAGATVTGDIYASSVVNQGATFNGQSYSAPSASPAPKIADLHDYRTYVYNGTTYSATQLGSGTLNNVTLGPTASNPLGIYWWSGNVTMTANVTINGSLLVKNGKLSVQGKSNKIIAPANTPALVIEKQLEVYQGNADLIVTGVVFAEQGVVGSGNTVGSSLAITGALLCDTTGISNIKCPITVTYLPAAASAPDLSSANQTMIWAKITSWSY